MAWSATINFTAAAVALMFAVAGCGDGDGDQPTATTTSPPPSTGIGDGANAAAGDACDALAEVTRIFSPTADPATATATAQAFADTAPAPVAGSARVIAEAIRAGFAEEEPVQDPTTDAEDPFDTPAFYAALAEATAFYTEECGETVNVTALDYAFEGLPESLPPGETAFRLVNQTKAGEEHEMVLLRRQEGADETIAGLLELPEEELFSKVEFTGVAFTSDEPGQASLVVVDLTPGEYIAVCNIPVGGGEEGEPHSARGMVHEFSVQ